MRRPSILMAVCAGMIVAACDSDSPVQPRSPDLALFSRVDPSSGVAASAVSPSEIDLTWQQSSTQVTGFQVFRSTTGATGAYSLLASTAATVTNYADVGLTESTTYCYEVRSFRTTGRNTTYSAYSEVACATTKPAPLPLPPPTFTEALPKGSTAVTIVWSSSVETASGFRVERASSNAGPWEAAATTAGTARSYVDTGRQSESLACYHVVALYANGESVASNVDCTTPPAAPTNLVAAPALDAVSLTWRDNSGVEDKYEVQRAADGVSFIFVAILPPNSTIYRDADVAPTQTYSYRVLVGKDGGASDNSNTVIVTVPAPDLPNAPSGTEVVPVRNEYFVDPYNSSVRVSWKDNSTNEDGFRVERAGSAAGPWTQVAATPANTTLWYLSAAREQQVCVRIIAFSAAGASLPAAPDCTTPPANPTNLVAKAEDGQSIALTWTDNSAAEDGYKVSRLDAAGAWTDIATLAANTVSYRDAAVTADFTYIYRVQALKDGGFSDYSNESSAVISISPPAAPSGASASYYADNEYGWLYFWVRWASGSSNQEGFRIEFSGDGVSGWQTYTTVPPNMASFQEKVSLLDSFFPHAGCYRVIAFNGAGESTPSNVTCTEWWNPPTNLSVTAVDQQSIDLSWTDNGSFERGYVVLRSTTVDGSYDFVAETPANATSYHDTGLATGQEYWYIVASDFGGDSYYDAFNYSDRVSATTLSAMGAMQLSRTVIASRLSSIRIRGRPTLEAIRARHPIPSDSPLTHARSPRRRQK
jgi:fibronectin type 3 domain-containing protein